MDDNLVFKPLFKIFEAGLICLGKVFLQSKDGSDVYLRRIYKLIVFFN